MKHNFLKLIFLLPLITVQLTAQTVLQPPALAGNGNPGLNNIADWEQKRRPVILELFKEEVYGKFPEGFNPEVRFSLEESGLALNGLAFRKQVVMRFTREGSNKTLEAGLLIYQPSKGKKPFPVFLGLNFDGNHTIHPDPMIRMSESLKEGEEEIMERGSSMTRWPVEAIVSRGYAVATVYYGDIDPDFDDEFKNGIHALLNKEDWSEVNGNGPASITAWAFGLSKALDYIISDKDLDGSKTILTGHSRLGKTALWAGACDPRFAMIISNNSGCGGAALSVRKHGETVERINNVFPHWFCGNFKKYNNREEDLPVDQHMLIALCAPRPVYVASAVLDDWADPVGEYQACYLAGEVYKLYKKPVLENPALPALNYPLKTVYNAYHIRSGGHDITPYDWEQYLDFADFHLGMKRK